MYQQLRDEIIRLVELYMETDLLDQPKEARNKKFILAYRLAYFLGEQGIQFLSDIPQNLDLKQLNKDLLAINPENAYDPKTLYPRNVLEKLIREGNERGVQELELKKRAEKRIDPTGGASIFNSSPSSSVSSSAIVYHHEVEAEALNAPHVKYRTTGDSFLQWDIHAEPKASEVDAHPEASKRGRDPRLEELERTSEKNAQIFELSKARFVELEKDFEAAMAALAEAVDFLDGIEVVEDLDLDSSSESSLFEMDDYLEEDVEHQIAIKREDLLLKIAEERRQTIEIQARELKSLNEIIAELNRAFVALSSVGVSDETEAQIEEKAEFLAEASKHIELLVKKSYVPSEELKFRRIIQEFSDKNIKLVNLSEELDLKVDALEFELGRRAEVIDSLVKENDLSQKQQLDLNEKIENLKAVFNSIRERFQKEREAQISEFSAQIKDLTSKVTGLKEENKVLAQSLNETEKLLDCSSNVLKIEESRFNKEKSDKDLEILVLKSRLKLSEKARGSQENTIEDQRKKLEGFAGSNAMLEKVLTDEKQKLLNSDAALDLAAKANVALEQDLNLEKERVRSLSESNAGLTQDLKSEKESSRSLSESNAKLEQEFKAKEASDAQKAAKSLAPKYGTAWKWFYRITALIAFPFAAILGGATYLYRAVLDYKKAAAQPVVPAPDASDKLDDDIRFLKPLLKWRSVKDYVGHCASWGTEVDRAKQYTRPKI